MLRSSRGLIHASNTASPSSLRKRSRAPPHIASPVLGEVLMICAIVPCLLVFVASARRWSPVLKVQASHLFVLNCWLLPSVSSLRHVCLHGSPEAFQPFRLP